ncbi:hypothetical protein H0H92_007623 [Tricholoma furcatifolium]|nr:hypothetical protein H0H92_007623 [Tricholoma furcatifolium]
MGALIQIMRTKQATRAAISNGAMQYPRTQRPWKKELQDKFRYRKVHKKFVATNTRPPRSYCIREAKSQKAANGDFTFACTVTASEPREQMTMTLVKALNACLAGA